LTQALRGDCGTGQRIETTLDVLLHHLVPSRNSLIRRIQL
jgi:hypothetical protein